MCSLFVSFRGKLNMLCFGTVGWTRRVFWCRHVGHWETCDGVHPSFNQKGARITAPHHDIDNLLMILFPCIKLIFIMSSKNYGLTFYICLIHCIVQRLDSWIISGLFPNQWHDTMVCVVSRVCWCCVKTIVLLFWESITDTSRTSLCTQCCYIVNICAWY